MPSDGANDPANDIYPKGVCIGYPAQALIVRAMKIESADLSRAIQTVQEQTSGGGGGCFFGIFALSGSYSNRSSERHFRSQIEGSRINTEGLQIIGFVNRLFPRAPNPLPTIKPEDFH